MGDTLTVSLNMNLEPLDIHSVSYEEDQCIICYDTNNGALCKGTDLFNSSCKCKYMVHKQCIHEWIKVKNTTSCYCICCNSRTTLKDIQPSHNDSLVWCNVVLLIIMFILMVWFVYR